MKFSLEIDTTQNWERALPAIAREVFSYILRPTPESTPPVPFIDPVLDPVELRRAIFEAAQRNGETVQP